jgi:hypothetical protein
MNLYAYVSNDPINLTDPFGLQGSSCSTGAADLCSQGGSSAIDGLGIGGVIISGAVSMVIGQQLSAYPTITVTGPRRCDFRCHRHRIRNQVLLRLYPEIEGNVRRVIDYIVGNQLTPAQTNELIGRVMDEITTREGDALSGVRAPSAGPLRFTRPQFNALRDVLRRTSYDALGRSTLQILTGSLLNGRVTITR